MKAIPTLALLGILPALIFPTAPLSAQHRASNASHRVPAQDGEPRTSIPSIARLLSVQVGWNGQERLEHQFGRGVRSIGGHPGGVESWRTRDSLSQITCDGFNYNEEGEVLETLEWALCRPGASLPPVRRLPQHAGWLGKIVPGMTERQVTRILKTTSLPPPKRSHGSWTWKQRGYVQVNESESYETWVATLEFKRGQLTRIEVKCE